MEVKPGYKQTEVGVIPENWDIDCVSRFWNVTDCKHVTAKFIDNGYPVASIKEVQSRFIDLTDAKQTTKQFYNLLAEGVRKPRTGDLILSRNATVGEMAQVADWHPPFAMGQDVCLLRGKSREFSSNFLQEVFCSAIIRHQLSDLMVGSTFKRVNVQQIKSLVVPMPQPTEQKAIAEALSDADALIESLEQILAKKRQLKQGAMQELLTGKKRLPGFKGEWKTRQLGDVIVHCASGATPYRGRPDYYKGTVKWITSGELNYNVITDTIEHISEKAVKQTNLTVHPVGTFLMAITGLEAAGTRGACGIVGSPATTNQSCMAIYPSAEMKTEYLYQYYVRSGNDLSLRYCQGTKQQSYTAKLVKLLPIDLPPTVEEQSAITSILSDMDAEIAALDTKLIKARQLKQGMMQELLTGRIRLV